MQILIIAFEVGAEERGLAYCMEKKSNFIARCVNTLDNFTPWKVTGSDLTLLGGRASLHLYAGIGKQLWRMFT